MSLIIDTYNVLHVTGVLPPEIAGIDTAALIELIRHSRYRHRRTTLVCDGAPGEGAPAGRIGPVTVRYGGPGPTADALIAAIIRRSSSPRRLTIVTSDRAVQREARRRRCEVLSSEQFLEHLATDHEQAEARGVRKTDSSARPTAEPAAADAAHSPGHQSAAAAVFPPDLLREAEAILREGLPEAPKPTAAGSPANTGGAGRGTSAADGQELPDHRQDDEPAREPPSEPVLPMSLVREALAMSEADHSKQVHGTSEGLDRPSGGRGAPGEETDRESDHPPAAAGEVADEAGSIDRGFTPPANLRGDDLLPPDIIRQAESLLGDDPDPGPDGSDVPAGEDTAITPPDAEASTTD